MKDFSRLDVKCLEHWNYVEFRLIGHFTISTLTTFTSKARNIFNATGQDLKAVIFNFEFLEMIDSSAVTTILNIHKHQAPVFICNIKGQVLDMLERLGLNKVVKIFEKREEMINASEFIRLISPDQGPTKD